MNFNLNQGKQNDDFCLFKVWKKYLFLMINSFEFVR